MLLQCAGDQAGLMGERFADNKKDDSKAIVIVISLYFAVHIFSI